MIGMIFALLVEEEEDHLEKNDERDGSEHASLVT